MEEENIFIKDSNSKDTDKFREYLIASKNTMFTLDLKDCTVIECINEMCSIK